MKIFKKLFGKIDMEELKENAFVIQNFIENYGEEFEKNGITEAEKCKAVCLTFHLAALLPPSDDDLKKGIQQINDFANKYSSLNMVWVEGFPGEKAQVDDAFKWFSEK